MRESLARDASRLVVGWSWILQLFWLFLFSTARDLWWFEKFFTWLGNYFLFLKCKRFFLNSVGVCVSDEQDRLLQHSAPGRSISQISFSEKTLMWLAEASWQEKYGRVNQYNVSFKWDIQRGWLVCLQRTKKSSRGCFRSKSECARRYTNQDVRMIFRFSSRKLERIRLDAIIRWTTPTERMLSWNEILLCCQRRDVPLTRTTGTFLTGEESDFLFLKNVFFFSCFFYGVDGMFFLKRSGKWFSLYYFLLIIAHGSLLAICI